MEKILSKELLLQNLNSTNLFVVKNCMLRIFDELLKGNQGLLSMQDIIFSQKSELRPEEFFKNLGLYFVEDTQRNAKKWDNFFNVLEQRRGYISICRLIVLDMYLSDKLNKQEKHRCCFWLNNHCQLGNHQELILKMLSYPEDGKLLLLANKYIAQEYSLSKQELDKICSLPLKASRKLDAYSLFIKQRNPKYDFAILSVLLQDLLNPSKSINLEEKERIWAQVVFLLQNNPLNEINNDLSINIDTFGKMYQEKKMTTDTYLDILDVYAEQIAFNITCLQKILNGYYQVLMVENRQSKLPRIKESLFSLLDMKNPSISDQVLSMMLKLMSTQKEEEQFKLYYLPEFVATVYKHAISIKKVKVSVMKYCLKVDENLFLLLLGKNIEGDIKSMLKEVVYDYPQLWEDCVESMFSGTLRNPLPIIKMIAELYEACRDEEVQTKLGKTIEKLLNNLPEKENVVANSDEDLTFMYGNEGLKVIADNYLSQAQEAMANYLIG